MWVVTLLLLLGLVVPAQADLGVRAQVLAFDCNADCTAIIISVNVRFANSSAGETVGTTIPVANFTNADAVLTQIKNRIQTHATARGRTVTHAEIFVLGVPR